jgi:hypothetical protein
MKFNAILNRSSAQGFKHPLLKRTQENEENYMIIILKMCALHLILNKEGRDGRSMYHVWGDGKKHTNTHFRNVCADGMDDAEIDLEETGCKGPDRIGIIQNSVP